MKKEEYRPDENAAESLPDKEDVGNPRKNQRNNVKVIDFYRCPAINENQKRDDQRFGVIYISDIRHIFGVDFRTRNQKIKRNEDYGYPVGFPHCYRDIVN